MGKILQEKVILVAGSSQGLGYAVAEASALEGANIVMGSRTAETKKNYLSHRLK